MKLIFYNRLTHALTTIPEGKTGNHKYKLGMQILTDLSGKIFLTVRKCESANNDGLSFT